MPSFARELAQEVLVDAPEHVAGAVVGAEADRADEVDELAEAGLVERGARVVLGKHAAERRVLALDRLHRLVDELPDLRLLRLSREMTPPSLRRNPEDVDRAVLVGILRARERVGRELRALPLESVRDVLEEDEAEDDVLVLRCVHMPAQPVRCCPERGLEAERRPVLAVLPRPRHESRA